MMKGKLKYLFIIGICLLGFATTDVFAANVGIYCIEQHPEMINDSGAVWCSEDNLWKNKDRPGFVDCSIRYEDGSCHKNYNIGVTVDGKTYEGYCADHGSDLHDVTFLAAGAYTCEVVSGDVGTNIANILSNSSLSKNQKTKALRDYTSGKDISVSNGSLSLSNPVENGNTVTFSINSNGVDLNQVTFSCSNGCSVQRNGNQLVATVSPQKGLCSFTITANYPGSENDSGNTGNSGAVAVRCHAKNQQDVYYLEGNASHNGGGNSSGGQQGSASYTYSYSFKEGGSYYNEYCSDQPNPNVCTCNQKTTVNMPGLCDIGTNNASINAPTDIKCCILNNKDEAGNTYQAKVPTTDGKTISDDNPYCSVFCKEDYEMTLPGAKYTTSGRFFELENSIVSAKRTCYTTSGTARESQEEYNIGIDQFVEKINSLQESLLNAFNELQKWKAYNESMSKKSVVADNSQSCHNAAGQYLGDNNTHIEQGPVVNYIQYSFEKDVDNDRNGKWVVKQPYELQAQYYYGHQGRCTPGPDSVAVGGPTPDEITENLTRYRELVNSLKEEIVTHVDYMKECYHWINDLCMDPVVEFDYEEQYNTSINYEKVSGGGEFPSTDAIYGTTKEWTGGNENYPANGGSGLETIDYAYCDENSCLNGGRALAEQISTLINKLYYRSIEANGSAEYANTQQFQTNYPHGTIDTVTDPSALRPNYSYLGAVFPLALNTPEGVYKWTLNFSNLGKYNDYVGCGLGRLDTVLAALGETSSANLEYVCVYVVDCDDCDYDCVGEGCLIPDEPKCPECDVYCTNCIFNGAGFTFNFEIETLHDSNPSERKRGANWSNGKGEETAKAIVELGEEVYKIADFAYRMTPEQMAAVRKYNAETQTYVREDLNYHTIGNVTNAYGTSKVLDEGQSKGYFTEIKRTKDRTLWSGAIGDGIGPAWKVGK